SDAGVDETASYDGATFSRRYAELGLDVSRPVSDDDVALALAYLPIWIAEPAHYARWFTVKARGAHEVTLSAHARVRLVLAFDDEARLVSIADGNGTKLLEVTW